MSPDPAPPHGVLRAHPLASGYAGLLADALPQTLAPLAPFFADLSRLDTLAAMLDAHLDAGPRGRAAMVLNAGCGPFASELFVGALQGRRIVSFDYTEAFVALGLRLQGEGRLPGVAIAQADAATVDYPEGAFDAVILHDLLYEQALDLEALLPRFARFLAPGGLLYLDFMDARVGWLWRMTGRERGYRRYRPEAVRAALSRCGLSVIASRPLRPRRGAARTALHLLLRLFGASNAVAMAARKPVSPESVAPESVAP